MSAQIQFSRPPGRIGSMEVRNRIIMALTGGDRATGNGFVTSQTKYCDEECARGGMGLSTPGVISIDVAMGRSEDYQATISDDRRIPGMSEPHGALHKHGIAGHFAEAAERAKRSGFEGFKIRAAHGYLLSFLLSPASNTRQRVRRRPRAPARQGGRASWSIWMHKAGQSLVIRTRWRDSGDARRSDSPTRIIRSISAMTIGRQEEV